MLTVCWFLLPGLTTDAKETATLVLQLWESDAPQAELLASKDAPTLTCYLPPRGVSARPLSNAVSSNASSTHGEATPAIVICPGGGYGGLAIDHEGHEIARYLQKHGIAGCVLKYRLPRSKTPGAAHGVPLADAQRAIRTVRSRAEEWSIDPNKIGIMGFSAGGHLASTAATHASEVNKESVDRVDRVSARPDFAVLVYPVISSDSAIWHKGSFINLVGPALDAKMLQQYSNERHVSRQTPPTFLVHAADDQGVPVENSLRFFQALQKAGVPAEVHIYEKGGHGFGMRPAAGPAAGWPDLLCQWLRVRGLLTP
jgi:acetyl esterase/lipase